MAPLRCGWCGSAIGRNCRRCGHQGLRALVTGARRTAEELGRALSPVPVFTSGGSRVLAQVGSEPAVVVATPGAEPVADGGGYRPAVLLDWWAMLGSPLPRGGEEALRRRLNAAALVRSRSEGGNVVIVADGSQRPSRRLFAGTRLRLQTASSPSEPPALPAGGADGVGTPPAAAVEGLLAVARLPGDAEAHGCRPRSRGARPAHATAGRGRSSRRRRRTCPGRRPVSRACAQARGRRTSAGPARGPGRQDRCEYLARSASSSTSGADLFTFRLGRRVLEPPTHPATGRRGQQRAGAPLMTPNSATARGCRRCGWHPATEPAPAARVAPLLRAARDLVPGPPSIPRSRSARYPTPAPPARLRRRYNSRLMSWMRPGRVVAAASEAAGPDGPEPAPLVTASAEDVLREWDAALAALLAGEELDRARDGAVHGGRPGADRLLFDAYSAAAGTRRLAQVGTDMACP